MRRLFWIPTTLVLLTLTGCPTAPPGPTPPMPVKPKKMPGGGGGGGGEEPQARIEQAPVDARSLDSLVHH